MKERDVRIKGPSGLFKELCPIDSSIREAHSSYSYLFSHLKTLDFSFRALVFLPILDRGYVKISLNL